MDPLRVFLFEKVRMEQLEVQLLGASHTCDDLIIIINGRIIA